MKQSSKALIVATMFQINPDRVYPTLLASKAIVRFQDCDPLRHLNNAKYFDYYFNAREDQILQNYALTSADFFQEYQAGWVAYNHNISYIKSVFVAEIVWIFSQVIYYDETTIVTEFYMTDIEQKVLKNLLWSTSKYIDVKTGKTIPHHDKVKQLLELITQESVNYTTLTKQERIRQIKSTLK